MKACLMRVNYDPRYTAPHQARTFDSMLLARDAYGPTIPINQIKSHPGTYGREERHGDEVLFRKRIVRPKINTEFASLKSGKHDKENRKTQDDSRIHDTKPSSPPKTLKNRSYSGGARISDHRTDQHKEGVAKAHNLIKLQPIKGLDNKDPLSRLLQGPYSDKATAKKQSTSSGIYSKKHGFYAQRSVDSCAKGFETSFPAMYQRSQTMPTVSSSMDAMPSHITKVKTPAILEVERRARREAEIAMRSRHPRREIQQRIADDIDWCEFKQRARLTARRAYKENKIFTIIGPYHNLRSALRRRGWVEKFQNAPMPCELCPKMLKKIPKSEHNNRTEINYDLTDEDDSWRDVLREHKLRPWEEENCFYGIMSHLVRNCVPSFIFTAKTNDVDTRGMKTGQLVNHYGKARSFTTKVGLCQNLRNLPWYEREDSDTFYPRVYMISEPDEKEAFIDEYRISTCFGFIKFFAIKYKPLTEKNPEELQEMHAAGLLTADSTQSNTQNDLDYIVPTGSNSDTIAQSKETPSPRSKDIRKSKSKGKDKKAKQKDQLGGVISVKALETALQQCEIWLRSKEHGDIDLKKSERNSIMLTDYEWDQFIELYYKFVHHNGEITPLSPIMVDQCEDLLNKAKAYNPQQLIDGYRNVWILKPGGKSRGRGIQCSDRLDSIIQKLNDSDESQFIAQKYIERPFLVYKTKFDIRQWFLVTDFNPLTIWFYKHNYLRFCSQEYTLDNFHESIHLSNNSVQKHYSNCADRSSKLPDDNMWTGEEFDLWLKDCGHGDVWQSSVIPGIKRALLCSLLCCQEFIECRKGAFELYGADFMMAEDLSPWLIEINSSPSMCRNTRATFKLVDMVMEDTVKVVLDRRLDKNADTGSFELLYRAPTSVEPVACDASFIIQGKKIRKKNKMK